VRRDRIPNERWIWLRHSLDDISSPTLKPCGAPAGELQSHLLSGQGNL
jgi:hypothetical protein